MLHLDAARRRSVALERVGGRVLRTIVEVDPRVTSRRFFFRRFFHEMRACGVIQEMTLEAPGHDQMCLGGPREGRGGLK